MCESYGKDTITGAPAEPAEYKAKNPAGKGIIKAAEFVPPHEVPSDDFPYQLTTGRTLYHFHTRTKTARAPQLNAAAPQVWIEMSAADATREGFTEGDLLEVASPRSAIQGQLRISGIRDGVIFVPFHYGYWDDPDGARRAANELTITDWDPLSKQPIFKTAAAAIRRIAKGGTPSAAPTTTASAPMTAGVPATVGGPAAEVDESVNQGEGSTSMSHGVNAVLRELHHGESELEREFLTVGQRHRTEHEVRHLSTDLARWSQQNLEAISRLADQHGSLLTDTGDSQNDRGMLAELREKTATLIGRQPVPGLLLLHDLRELYLMASRNSVNWTMLGQAVQATRDHALLNVVTSCHTRTLRQVKWCNATIKSDSPQILSSL